jgi:hypothetical protein
MATLPLVGYCMLHQQNNALLLAEDPTPQPEKFRKQTYLYLLPAEPELSQRILD